MAQQINLIDARLLPRVVSFGGRHAGYGMLAVLALGTLGAVALQLLAAHAAADLRVMQQQVASLQAAASAPVAATARNVAPEIEQLRAIEAGQRHVRSALEAGVAGEREGPADYFMALARQAQGSVWITGFSISDNGAALEIEGRVTETDLLPGYLRQLTREPRFKGRAFAQMQLSGNERQGGAPLPYTEFALRSRPSQAKGS